MNKQTAKLVFLVLIGLLLIISCAYLIGWWGGYRHGVTVNLDLLVKEARLFVPDNL